jgi:hypothetical protein
MSDVPLFRLYLLARVRSGKNTEFSVLAEFKSYRSAERVKVRLEDVSGLVERMRSYRHGSIFSALSSLARVCTSCLSFVL